MLPKANNLIMVALLDPKVSESAYCLHKSHGGMLFDVQWYGSQISFALSGSLRMRIIGFSDFERYFAYGTV